MLRNLKRTLLAASVLAAGAADARVTLITYAGSGVVSDTAGIFGAAHADFRQANYLMVFRVDDTLGSLYDSGYAERLSGYASASGPSAVTARLSIDGGRSHAFAGTAYGYAQQRTTQDGVRPDPEIEDQVVSQQFADPTVGRSDQLYAYLGNGNGLDDFLTTRDFHAPLSHPAAYGDYFGAGFNIYGPGGHAAGAQAIGYLGVSSVTVTAAGVPEPASWALLTFGFAVTGRSLRRRPAVRRVQQA